MADKALSSKLKKLKHVQVYNQIFKLIQDGVYPPGMQLPSEPELAEQLNVSRATLRKSLALLQEDHLVKNIRGKGNFISDSTAKSGNLGLERLQHPVKACLNLPIENTELEFRIEVPSDSIKKSLKQETPIVVIVDRWYHTNQGVTAYSLSFLPVEVVSEFGLSLQDPTSLTTFLEDRLYKADCASHAQSELMYTKAGNFSATKYHLSQHSDFMLIQENVFNNEKLLVSSKHYIPLEHFEMLLNSQNKSL